MQYYRCKCGTHEAYGSMSPPRCAGCEQCGTDLSTHPDFHRKPLPHDFSSVQSVETDEGKKTITLCRYCGKTKKELGIDPAPSNVVALEFTDDAQAKAA